MSTVLNPERVVIGGGVAEAGDLILEPARRRLIGACVCRRGSHRGRPRAELGYEAGSIGAALGVPRPRDPDDRYRQLPVPGRLEHAAAHLDAFGPDDVAEMQEDAVIAPSTTRSPPGST